MGIHLEVAGVDNLSCRRLDAQGIALGNGMTNRKEVKVHVTQGDHLFRGDHVQMDKVQDVALLELVLDQGQGQGRAVDVHAAQFGHNPGQGAYVVLVSMGQDYAQDIVFDGRHGSKVRNEHVHT